MQSKTLKIFKISYACFLLIFFSEPVYAELCKPHIVNTTVSNSISPVKYAQKFYSSNLTEFHNDSSMDSGAQDTVLGLMGGGISNVFTARFEVIPQKSGDKYCLSMKRIDVKFAAKPTVHIARNFPKGSCEYTSVLRHELKHVKILKRAYQEYIPKYKTKVQEIARNAPILPEMGLADVNYQKEYMIGYVNYYLSEYIQAILDDITIRQMTIDTPASYKNDVGNCDAWSNKL